MGTLSKAGHRSQKMIVTAAPGSVKTHPASNHPPDSCFPAPRKLAPCLIVTVDAELAPTAKEESPQAPSRIGAREWLLPAALAVIMLVQLLSSVRQLSQTSDEALHLYAGYRYWLCRDFAYDAATP